MLKEEVVKSKDLLTLWEFEGVLKYSPFFYGWYTNQDSNSKYRLPLAYFVTNLVVYTYSFVAILRKYRLDLFVSLKHGSQHGFFHQFCELMIIFFKIKLTRLKNTYCTVFLEERCAANVFQQTELYYILIRNIIFQIINSDMYLINKTFFFILEDRNLYDSVLIIKIRILLCERI